MNSHTAHRGQNWWALGASGEQIKDVSFSFFISTQLLVIFSIRKLLSPYICPPSSLITSLFSSVTK